MQTPAPVNSIDRFYPIDMYAGVQLGNYAVSVGKQSLWLGPTEMGALMVSNNADPMYSVRLTRTEPLVLPGFLRLLGSIREEIMFAKLSGHQFPARPFFNLQKITFHPTDNLEAWLHAIVIVGRCRPSVYLRQPGKKLWLGDESERRYRS